MFLYFKYDLTSKVKSILIHTRGKKIINLIGKNLDAAGFENFAMINNNNELSASHRPKELNKR